MTTETQDWTTMPAGRDLDALVAERVMGWQRVATKGATLWRVPGDGPARFGGPNSHRAYSTNLVAAWEVVMEMEARGLSVSLRCEQPNGPWSCALWHQGDYRHVADEIQVGPPPFAICRAALAACAP